MRLNFSKISITVSVIGLVLIILGQYFLVTELIKPQVEDHSGNYLFIVNLTRIITLILLITSIILAFSAKHYRQKNSTLALIFAILIFALYWIPVAQIYLENFTNYDINFKSL